MVIQNNNTDLDFYSISSQEAGPHLLIISGIHGDEFEPMLASMNLINSIEKILSRGKVTVVPVANRSAYYLGKRCGDDKLDLARTFPGKKTGTTTDKLAQSISELIQEADYLVDLHSGGTLFDIMPLSGYMLHPDSKILRQQQKIAKSFNLPLIWGTDPLAQGRSLSVARDHNVPAIYVECGGGLKFNKANVKLYENGCINVIYSLNMATFKRENIRIQQRWLEDYRPGQGHLQVKLPAPADGIFSPEVKIGKTVKRGALLGYIIDPLKQTKTQIISEEKGLLFMLRISSRVNVGESLGGILPLSGRKKKIIHAK